MLLKLLKIIIVILFKKVIRLSDEVRIKFNLQIAVIKD